MKWFFSTLASMVAVSAAVLAAVLTGGVQQVHAASAAEAMASVVAVLPDWPQGYKRPGGALEEPEGSAVAIFPGGYLATNVHVLGGAERIDIRLGDGRLIAAEIVGRDPRTDIALLKTAMDFPVPEIAAAPAPGQPVCAIGNQFGLGISLTCGVVSALRRSNAGFNPVEDFVQTDAAVNPGASGGALVDGMGRLVGLLSAIFTKQSDANIGVNFASSSALLLRVASDLRDHGRVRVAFAGWRLARLGKKERRRISGARVMAVEPGGAAARAGIKPGDVVTRLGTRAVALPSDARAATYLARAGERLSVELMRDGAAMRLELAFAP